MNKCVDIIVGAQAGSEGKGGIASMLAHEYKALVRTGGCNAAHSIVFNNEKIAFHQIPCGALHAPDALLVLGAAAQIDIDHLVEEIALLKKHDRWLDSNGKVRLVIDPHATIIDPIDKIAENGGRMPDCGDLYFHPRDCNVHNGAYNNESVIADEFNRIKTKVVTKEADTCMGCPMLPKDSAWSKLGSTTHGAGANLIRKIARGTKMAILPGQKLNTRKLFVDEEIGNEISFNEVSKQLFNSLDRWVEGIEAEPIRFAEEDDFLRQFIGNTVYILNEMVDRNEPIMLEGTQGAMLSLHHSYKNKCTSRDTNAANWLTDAGLSPLCVRDIYGVARTFPIRVAGDSGPLSGTEISWEEVTEHATSKPIREWQKEHDKLWAELESIEHGKEWPQEKLDKVESLKHKIAEVMIREVTTATKRERRVFLFGEDDFRKACIINRPTVLALTFVDYLNIDDYGKSSWDSLAPRTRDWITTLESKTGVFFKMLSTGPKPEHAIIRKTPGEMATRVQAAG